MQDCSSFENARHELARREVEPELDANRTDGRSVMDAEAGGRTQVGQAHTARAREDVAGIDEGDSGEALRRADTQLRVEHDLAVSALGKARVRIDGIGCAETIERETANR